MAPWSPLHPAVQALRNLLPRTPRPQGAAATQPAAEPAPAAAPARLQEALLNYLQRAAAGRLGFRLEQRCSTIPGAGDGVFLVAGAVPAHSVVSLYPGAYLMAEPEGSGTHSGCS